MRFRIGNGWVSFNLDYSNRVEMTIYERDGQFDEKSSSVLILPVEWERIKKVGDLMVEQSNTLAQLERELND